MLSRVGKLIASFEARNKTHFVSNSREPTEDPERASKSEPIIPPLKVVTAVITVLGSDDVKKRVRDASDVLVPRDVDPDEFKADQELKATGTEDFAQNVVEGKDDRPDSG